MMLERNSAEIAKYIGGWLSTNARPGRGENNSRAVPPKTVPTFSTDNLTRKGVFYAGGQYRARGRSARDARGDVHRGVSAEADPAVVPVILWHANGQTGVQWLQTPDGRPGWAYRLLDEGFVVYVVDYPARGRSPYVPVPDADGKTPLDGNLNIRTALELERIWTNTRERGDFPLKTNHTQWPGAGKVGDPIFDFFMKSQVQFANATGALTPSAGVALLDMINTPVIVFTHSQGGGSASRSPSSGRTSCR